LTGVEISGRKDLKIERVLVKNAAGKLCADAQCNGFYEAFVLMIRTCDSAEDIATGTMISDCEVSDFKGGYCTAIGIAGNGSGSLGKVSGTVQNCRVKFPPKVSGDFFAAYGSGGSNGILYENNISWGANKGFNNDYQTGEKIALRGNLFLDVTDAGSRGAVLLASHNSVLEGNIFSLIGTGTGGGGVAAVAIGGMNSTNWSGAENWILQGNLIFTAGTAPAGISFAASGDKPLDCVFQDNRMSGVTSNDGLPNPDTFNHWYNNTDFSGNNNLPSISSLQITNRWDSSKNGPP